MIAISFILGAWSYKRGGWSTVWGVIVTYSILFVIDMAFYFQTGQSLSQWLRHLFGWQK